MQLCRANSVSIYRMNNIRQHILRFLGFFAYTLCALVAIGYAGDTAKKKEIGRTTEKEINVVLSTGFGQVTVGKGQPERIVAAEGYSKSESGAPINFEYEIRNRIGYLDLSLGEDETGETRKKGSFKFSGFDGGAWDLSFSNAIPISFDVELGVAKGVFDLTGLQVKDFKLSAGASDVTVVFGTPNTSTIDEMSIESGVGKFEGKNLGNANFKSFKYEGGVGSATLDFSGKIQNEVDVNIEVGLGVCTIILPYDVGAKVLFEESLVSKIDCDKSFHASGEGQYLSDNFKSAAGRMNIHIDTGMGRVKVRRK